MDPPNFGVEIDAKYQYSIFYNNYIMIQFILLRYFCFYCKKEIVLYCIFRCIMS